MKRYLSKAAILLTALLTSGLTWAQDLTIDQINSDDAALLYVKQMNYDAKQAPQWKFFYLTTGNEWQSYYNFSNQQIAAYEQQTQATKWFKTDLNGDGKTDLIVSGYIAKRPGDWATATFKILVFLSEQGKNYTEVNILPENSDKYPAYFNQLTLNNKHYIQLSRWLIQNNASELPYQQDTVTFSKYWGSFLNYHKRGMRSSDITSINYKVMEDLAGSYHALNIDLLSSKKTNMEIIVKNAKEKVPDINKARLAKGLWVEMDTLIRSSYVVGRKKGDTTFISHENNNEQLPTFLTVTYADGHTETVQDYSPGASYSMMNIYNCMENIIQNVFAQLQRRQEILSSMISGGLDF
ncbi:hypothetical protein GCM10027566_39430 [Arachidicoccus ginsenosidivorans]|jgi:hypothetical protein